MDVEFIAAPGEVVEASVVCRQAGGCPAATYFLLLRQKKVSKEKATPLPASPALRSGATCGARSSRCRVRTRCAQTIARPDPAGPALLGAVRRGGIEIGSAIGLRQGRAKRVLASPHPHSFLHPVGLGRGAQAKADQGSRLSEPKASSSETPLLASTAGCPQRSGGTQTIGSPFFSLGFFGEAKKSKSPAGARPGLQAHRSTFDFTTSLTRVTPC